jgi:hypothetical protein
VTSSSAGDNSPCFRRHKLAVVPIDPRHTGPRRDVARLTGVEVVTEVAWLEILARLGTIFAHKELQEVSFDALAAR